MMLMPPSTSNSAPTMKVHSSEARNTAALAIACNLFRADRRPPQRSGLAPAQLRRTGGIWRNGCGARMALLETDAALCDVALAIGFAG